MDLVDFGGVAFSVEFVTVGFYELVETYTLDAVLEAQ